MIRVMPGDCLEVMPTLGMVQAIVTDPPYHLTSIVKRFGAENAAPAKSGKTGAYARASSGFMGKQWDGGDVAFRPETWRLCYDLLPPGGYLVAFSGTRTYHRMACAVEDAGFEIRDQLQWLYGSGFPKSHDVSKAIDREAGAERKKIRDYNPRNPKSIDGGHHIDGGDRPWIERAREVGYHEIDSSEPATAEAQEWQGWGTALKPACEPIVLARKPLSGTVAGNVLEHGTGALNVEGCRIGDNAGWSYPNGRGGKAWHDRSGLDQNLETPIEATAGRWPANVIHDGSPEVMEAFPDAPGQQRAVNGDERAHRTVNAYGEYGRSDGGMEPRNDQGSAARFYYTAKAGADDRWGSKHPTVKPVSLMRWLVRLVTPPGGTVLDPFAGTGTTGAACFAEGFDCVLIEREQEYLDDIKERIAWLEGRGKHSAHAKARKREPRDELPLFK